MDLSILMFGLCPFVCSSVCAEQTSLLNKGNELSKDSIVADTTLYAFQKKKNYLLPAAEVAGSNVILFCYDRFVIAEPFSHVTLNVIKDNYKTGFVWDNDAFYTDLLSHPFNGNMYFNMARSNGLSYYESMTYNAFGSLTWEMFGENEPPAIQDWFSTTFGGACIGEVTNRISKLFLNDNEHGLSRFMREGAAMIVNPMLGIHRLLRGESMKIHNNHYLYHNFEETPVECHLSLGGWNLSGNRYLSSGKMNPYFNLMINYGDAIKGDIRKPFDYFNADFTFAVVDNKPLVNTIRILGNILMGRTNENKYMSSKFGLFQYFNYYNSDIVKEGAYSNDYRIAEALGLGPGVVMRFPCSRTFTKIEQQFYADAVIMGGVKSDYLKVSVRDYNMGSGYSLKAKTIVCSSNIFDFNLDIDYYRLFTWNGWENKDYSTISPSKYNIQGDKSNAEMIIIAPTLFINIWKQFGIQLCGNYYYRHTRYAYHNDVEMNNYELKIGLSWWFSRDLHG
jgi:hypothetical protein